MIAEVFKGLLFRKRNKLVWRSQLYPVGRNKRRQTLILIYIKASCLEIKLTASWSTELPTTGSTQAETGWPSAREAAHMIPAWGEVLAGDWEVPKLWLRLRKAGSSPRVLHSQQYIQALRQSFFV